MKKTYRMQRGFISLLFIGLFLILWFFFYKLYPLIVEQITLIQLPQIESNIFLIPVGLMVVTLFVNWSIRNKLWFGLFFSLHYYLMTKRIRRHIKDARFEDEREFDNRLVTLPKIKITFDDIRTRKSGKVFIKNTIKFDKKLEECGLIQL